ncbi:MAG: ABC transporter ATP-binding protein [Acidimicrobiia bacterium]|nr:ABC transporter ATP-binding protein [Acidimicrobiia bacterium]
MTEQVVVTRDVSKVYGSGHAATTALREASIHLHEGEFMALLGPSGSGKTTLLSIVGALLTPTSGEVTVAGEDVTRLTARARSGFRARRIGFVFQHFNLVPFLTAAENMLVAAQFASVPRHEAQARVARLLDELGLAGVRNQVPSRLSGGERQRVAIGRALMNDPDVILVDEPTANLDTKLGTAVVELLAHEIRSRHKAGIMVTHDVRMVDFTDRTVEILDGTVRC